MSQQESSTPAPSWQDEMTHAAHLFEAGQLADAAAIFKRLCEREDLSNGIRAMLAHNLATTYDKMGHPEHAISTHEYGVSLAVRDYVFAQQNRAAYLAGIGHNDEAIAIWEQLLTLDFIADTSAEAIRRNTETVRARG